MRLFGLLVGLGLAASVVSAVGIGEGAELKYHAELGWLLGLPGPEGDCRHWEVAGEAAGEDDAWLLEGFTVADYDEDVGTITLSHPDEVDRVIEFEYLSGWLDTMEEPALLASVSEVLIHTTSCTATVPGHTCSCSANGAGATCTSGTTSGGTNWAKCKDNTGTMYCTGKSGSCSCEAL